MPTQLQAPDVLVRVLYGEASNSSVDDAAYGKRRHGSGKHLKPLEYYAMYVLEFLRRRS